MSGPYLPGCFRVGSPFRVNAGFCVPSPVVWRFELPHQIFVEAEVVRCLKTTSQLPLARHRRRVAGRLKIVRDRPLRGVEIAEVIIVPEVVLPGQERRAGGRAERRRVRSREAHAVGRQPIDVRHRVRDSAVAPEGFASDVIGEVDNDVRPPGVLRRLCPRDRSTNEREDRRRTKQGESPKLERTIRRGSGWVSHRSSPARRDSTTR